MAERRLRILFLLAWALFLRQPVWGQPPRVGEHSIDNEKNIASIDASQAINAQSRTENAPLSVELKERPKSKAETAQIQRDEGAKRIRDIWTFWATLFSVAVNAALLIIGICGVRAAIMTLRQIRRQANLMRGQLALMRAQDKAYRESATAETTRANETLGAIKGQLEEMKAQAEALRTQAKTAELHAQALMSAERPWLVVSRVGGPEPGWYLPQDPRYRPGVNFEFTVVGNTPARIIDARFKLESLAVKLESTGQPDLPPMPDYTGISRNAEIPENGRIIVPRRRFQIGIGLSRLLEADEWQNLRDNKTVMCAHGFVRYSDSFGIDHETQICYVYRFRWGGVRTDMAGNVLDRSGFELGGPLAYNRST